MQVYAFGIICMWNFMEFWNSLEFLGIFWNFYASFGILEWEFWNTGLGIPEIGAPIVLREQ